MSNKWTIETDGTSVGTIIKKNGEKVHHIHSIDFMADASQLEVKMFIKKIVKREVGVDIKNVEFEYFPVF